jgi:hypothetical protein
MSNAFLGSRSGKLRALALTGAIMGLLGPIGCDRELPKNILEFPEPWQSLDPGRPIDKSPRTEVVTPGNGSAIQPGDLVQIRIFTQSTDKQTWNDRGEWWLWIAFRSAKETRFYSYEPAMASAFTGLREGTIFEFLEPKQGIGSGPQYAGKLWITPLGDKDYYSWRKHDNKFTYLYIADASGGSRIEIQRVCKGKLQYRTVRLYDDGPVRLGQGYQTWISHEPREMWVDEARIDTLCGDGKSADFQYGPLPSSGKEARTVVTGYFDQWFKNAWDKLPKGVQLTSR